MVSATTEENNLSESERVAGGDVALFRKLFLEMHTALYLTALRVVDNDEVAKDIVSDVFLQVWENAGLLRQVADVNAYLYVMTRNRSLKHVAKEKRVHEKRTELETTAGDADTRSFLQGVFDTEMVRALYAAVNGLPAECRRVMLLSLQGLGTNEIAAELGISASAVSNQKSRGVKLLRERLPLSVILLAIVTMG